MVKNKVAGSLQEKNGKWYALINYKVNKTSEELKKAEEKEHLNEIKTGIRKKIDPMKRKYKWVATGLDVKNNKRKAEEKLEEVKRNFIIPSEDIEKEEHTKSPNNQETNNDGKTLFHDYMQIWLQEKKIEIGINTYSSYQQNVNAKIIPYFKEKNIYLEDITDVDIKEFYRAMQETGIKVETIKKYHANIRCALIEALNEGKISGDIILKLKPPKKPDHEIFVAGYYKLEELNECFKIFEGDPLHLLVQIAAFYGMRRSEILGLKWENIDFINKIITVKKVLGTCTIDHKQIMFVKDRTKNKKYRSLPLVPEVEKLLQEKLSLQEKLHKLMRKEYCTDYLEYICVNHKGKIMRPDYVTEHFKLIVEKNAETIKKITFHGLRHSCASLLALKGVPLQKIAAWLGHVNTSVTERYAHLDFSAQMECANELIDSGIKIGE